MDDFHVNNKFLALVADDENSDASTTSFEGLGKTRPQVGLINDRKGLLDITCLGHCNDGAILHVEDTILLEQWT